MHKPCLNVLTHGLFDQTDAQNKPSGSKYAAPREQNAMNVFHLSSCLRKRKI